MINCFSAHEGRLDAAFRCLSGVRRHGMPVLEPRSVTLLRRVGIEDHEVGIVTDSDRAFAMIERGQFRGLLTHPACYLADGEPAAARFGPNNRQCNLQRSDATPSLEKASIAARFHFRRTGRMVRCY